MPLGLYISVPFCRTKCSYCNFASGVFSQVKYQGYVERLCRDIQDAPRTAAGLGAEFERGVDSIYLGGGTPTILDPRQVEAIFRAVCQVFDVMSGAEITVECAPGTLTEEMLAAMTGCGVNRASLGAQSFVNEEARAVGRQHNADVILDDVRRLRSAGIENLNLDLIAGLPHQTAESWQQSLAAAVSSRAPHVSVYMLEVDEDSRLGNELIAGGGRYHAHFVPDDDLTAAMYEAACETLEAAGITQYEISNFARPGFESRHNLKYWTRQPYFGFGVDAHSMLLPPQRTSAQAAAIRFAWPDSLESFVAESEPRQPDCEVISRRRALEEEMFLGLRLSRGIDLDQLQTVYGHGASELWPTIDALCENGLLQRNGAHVALTARGRLLANEVFARFIASAVPTTAPLISA